MDFRRMLAAILLTAPLAWLLGVDQFMLFLVLPVILASTLSGPLQLNRHNRLETVFLSLLLFAVVLSSVSLLKAPAFRWVTYLRDLLSISAVVAILLLQRPARSDNDAHGLVLAIVWFLAAANLVGIIAWLTDFTSAFVSPVAQLVPAFVRDSDLGQSIFVKYVLREDPTYLFGQELARVRSLFIYSNTYALALGIGLPLTFYMMIRASMRGRGFMVMVYLLAFAVSVMAMFLTASRAGMIAAAIGATVFGWVLLRNALSTRSRILIELMLAAVALVAVAMLFNNIDKMIYELAYARGAGSFESRMLVYYESFRQLAGNPIGFGTQRDAAGLVTLPLGSHSTFVAIGFKFGFLGLGAYLGFLAVLTLRIFSAMQRARGLGDREAMLFFAVALWAQSANIAHQVLAEIALDTLTLTVIVSFWLVMILRTQPQPGPIAHPVTDYQAVASGAV